MTTIQTLIDASATGSVYALMAVGIGLVFGVLRLVNFAYGQLVMAGAYALALTNGLNPVLSIVVCFAVVIALTMTLDVVAFRPLRRRAASPATMLVATFAISFLLQSIATLKLGVLGKTVGTLTGLNRPIGHGTLIVRWIWIVAIVVAADHARAAPPAAEPHEPRPAHARGRGRLPDGAAARRARERGDLVRRAPLGRPRGDRRGRDDRRDAVRHVRLRAARHDHRARRRRRRRDRPPLERDARRLRDRVRERRARTAYLPSVGTWPFTSGVYLDSAVFALVILVLLVRPDGLFVRRARSAVERV